MLQGCIIPAMAEKYREILPPDSIWFHLNREETMNFIDEVAKQEPKSKEQLPADKLLLESKGMEIQTFPGNIDSIEEIMKKAEIEIKTFFD